MDEKISFLSARLLRRYAAVLLCLAVFYFAAGGSFLHRHTGGQETTVCHVCQSLHAPALAAAAGVLLAAPQIMGWHDALPAKSVVPSEVSLHHAGRAPPAV